MANLAEKRSPKISNFKIQHRTTRFNQEWRPGGPANPANLPMQAAIGLQLAALHPSSHQQVVTLLPVVLSTARLATIPKVDQALQFLEKQAFMARICRADVREKASVWTTSGWRTFVPYRWARAGVLKSDRGVCLSGPKRHPNTKISPRIACLNPPSFRGLHPLKVFVFGLFFSLKCRKNANTNNFEGGRAGKKQIFVLDFFACFFFFLSLSLYV